MRLHWDIAVDVNQYGTGWLAVGRLRKDGQVDLEGPSVPVIGVGDALLACVGRTEDDARGQLTALLHMTVMRRCNA